ncbi:hypothetical protein PTKIN_Ptkin08bG0096700 [Pterospermum kingtungense]
MPWALPFSSPQAHSQSQPGSDTIMKHPDPSLPGPRSIVPSEPLIGVITGLTGHHKSFSACFVLTRTHPE